MLKFEGLYQEGFGTELIRAVYVAKLVRRSENDHGQACQVGLGLHPEQDLEPVHFGHFQIQEKQRRERKFAAVGVGTLALEIINRLFAVPDNLKRIMNPGRSKSALNEQDIVLKVFSE